MAVSPTGEIYVTDQNSRITKYFDPSDWVSGTPHFGVEGAAVGYGQVLGPSVTLDTTHGLLVDGAMTIQSGGSLTVNPGGNVTAGTLTNSGQFFVTGGSVTIGGGTGTLMNNATMALNGSVSGSLTNNYGASLYAAGTVTGNLANQGTLTQNGLLSVSGNLTNSGLVLLAGGGAISGTSNFTNGASGTIRGDGAITVPLTNSGGLIYANGTNGLTLSCFTYNGSGGELRVADGDSLTVLAAASGYWTNTSTITLQGANATLNGDKIYNYYNGTISGQGRITNQIANIGTICAVGSQLVLAGPSITNYVAGTPVGTIESAAGTSIVVSQGLATNSGIIALTGGSFDNNGNTMTNYGSILGNGTFSTGMGGLYNYSTVTFSDGNSSIFGDVTNNSGGTLSTYGTSSATTITTFYGPVINSSGALIQTSSSTVRFLGGFSNNGTYTSDPSCTCFTGLAVGASGVLQGGVGDQFFVTAPFTNAGEIDLGGTSEMVVENSGTLTQTSGVLHLGSSATLSAGTVQINGGTLLADGPLATITASLLYVSPSTSTYQGIVAGAGNSLTVNNLAALLILSGASNSYTGGTNVEAGTLEITTAGGIPDGTSLTVGAGGTFIFDSSQAGTPVTASSVAAVPEPGTLPQLGVGILGLLAWAWRTRLASPRG